MLNAKDILQAKSSRSLKKLVRKGFVAEVKLIIILEEWNKSGECGTEYFKEGE